MNATLKQAAGASLQKIFELIVNSGAAIQPGEFIEKLESWAENSPDQLMALNNFERFLSTTPNIASVVSDFGKSEKLSQDFLRIVSTSQYLADIMVTHPTYFRFLFSPVGIENQLNPAALLSEITRQVSIYGEASHKTDYIRRIYKREILRIGGRDICGRDELPGTTLQISQLADSILKSSFEIVTEIFKMKYGVSPPPVSCIALGKFGGNELNYSSDIDLMFLYSDSEDSQEISEKANYFVNQLVKLLTSESPEGHLYRIDLRLRPDGAAGSVARSLGSAITYYESRGELWERQMLIKARHVAGEELVSSTFLNHMRPFVYPRTWFENPIDEIPRMKVRIEAANPNELNVKSRRGGIRDIEFIVQALQLLNGGLKPEVREGNTLIAIMLLGKNKIISKQESSLLTDAYSFYRLVEHRLQLLLNIQTHTLPSDLVEFRNLSKRCGYKNERRFRNELFGYFDRVAGMFDSVFKIDQPIERSEIEQLLEGSLNDERTKHVLENYGLVKSAESYRNTQFLSRGVTRAGDVEFPAVVTKAFREIAPALFEDMKLTVDPDLTLRNLARIVPTVKSLEVFYGSLADENFRRLILTLCSKATRFVDYLTVQPILFDLAISRDQLLDRAIFVSDSLGTPLLKEFNELKLGMLYLLGEITLHEMEETWTRFTETLLTSACDSLFHKNKPTIIAGGKLGTREMSFLSDLNVIFILPDKHKAMKPAIEKKISKLQELFLDENGAQVISIDLKLRPEGKSAPLLMTESEYKVYLEKRLSIWELMAMTRFRSLSNDQEVMNLISHALQNFQLTRDALKEILSLYSKVIQSKSYFDEIDIKFGDGGIFAIEFLVQALILKDPKRTVAFIPASVPQLIDELRGIDFLEEAAAEEIKESYEFYRMIEFSNYVSLSKTSHKIPHDEAELASLSALLDFKNPTEFSDSLKSRMRHMSSLFKKTIQDLQADAK